MHIKCFCFALKLSCQQPTAHPRSKPSLQQKNSCCTAKRSLFLCAHAVKQKASLAKSGLTSLATAAGGMYCVSTCVCVSVCLRLCVRVFVSVKTRWPDCSAEQWGKTRPRVVTVAPMKNAQEMDHNAPWLAAPPLTESLCVFVRVPCLPS